MIFELADCPFCGKKGNPCMKGGEELHWIGCLTCATDGPVEETLENAIMRWNLRP
jgi:hypothetical protein